MSPKLSIVPEPTLRYCSFCGRSEEEAAVLVAGATTFICDSCVDQCAAIVASKRAEAAARERDAKDEASIATIHPKCPACTEGVMDGFRRDVAGVVDKVTYDCGHTFADETLKAALR